jgi:hypothetical protein
MTTIIDPVRLVGLKQAAYVMECLVKNASEEQIVSKLGGDEQLYDMWKIFLKYNQWVTETMQGWMVTAKGRMWSERLTSA